MNDEDWDEPDPNYKPFFLFKDVSPEEEAKKDGFVNLDVYNHWKKAERKLYQKLKAEKILKQVKDGAFSDIDDISKMLSSVNIFKTSTQDETVPAMNDLTQQLESMTLKPKNTSK